MQIWVICMILYFTLPLNIEQIQDSHYPYGYELKIHSITVRNNGDLPVYLNFMDDPLMDGGWWLCRGFKWYFDSDYRSGWYNGIRDWVLPGKTKVIPVGAKISYNIPRDGRHHKLTMVVTDREGDIIIPVSITTPK